MKPVVRLLRGSPHPLFTVCRRRGKDDSKKVEFLIEGYRVATSQYDSFMNRMWNRFNIVVTLDSALFALFLTKWFDPNLSTAKPLILFPIAGFMFPVLLYAQSAQDKFISTQLFLRINNLRDRIAAELDLGDAACLPLLFSSTPDFEKPFCFTEITSWRIRLISVTRLPAWFSLLFALMWLVLGTMILIS